MKKFQKIQKIADGVLSGISLEDMVTTVEYFSHLHRYTGYPEAERAVGYLMERMDEYAIPYKKYEYEAYLSLPVHASLQVVEPEQLDIPVIADVFSEAVNGLEGELYFDVDSLCTALSEEEQGRRFQKFKDKIILSYQGAELARKAYDAGAKALIHISVTSGDIIHHRGIGTVWGNPDLDELSVSHPLPSIGIGRNDAERLIEFAKKRIVKLRCSATMDSGVRKSTMAVAEIPGKSESFVLLSGHYDSWYEGITDNATSDAILLELARVFYKNRVFLERGIKIAWWSGHSDGRYAGSAWYCDNEWQNLRKHCVGHINLDLAGCKGAKQIMARTTLMEGMDFTADAIEGLTGLRPQTYAPMIRGADQSFWGANIPIVIMPKYEPLKSERISPCPGGGPWWHTADDTLDKMDKEHLLRDARLSGVLLAQIAFGSALPLEMGAFIGEMEKILIEIWESLSEEFILDPIFRQLAILREQVRPFQQELAKRGPECDRIVKETAGELVRITYSYTGRYEHDAAISEKTFPGLRKAAGIYRGEVSEKTFLAARTTFIRQRNRLAGQIEKVNDIIAAQLQKWEERT